MTPGVDRQAAAVVRAHAKALTSQIDVVLASLWGCFLEFGRGVEDLLRGRACGRGRPQPDEWTGVSSSMFCVDLGGHDPGGVSRGMRATDERRRVSIHID